MFLVRFWGIRIPEKERGFDARRKRSRGAVVRGMTLELFFSRVAWVQGVSIYIAEDIEISSSV